MITKGKWYWEYDRKGHPFNLRSEEQRKDCLYDANILLVGDDFLGQFSFANHHYNAEFIVEACNACKEINEEHPELVAKHIKEIYFICEMFVHAIEKDCQYQKYFKVLKDSPFVDSFKTVLSKIKGGE